MAEQADRGALRSVRVQADATEVTVEVEAVVDLTLLRLIRVGEPFVVRISSTARPHLRP